ncbi:tetratricopeptide repeat protein [Nostoc sp.]
MPQSNISATTLEQAIEQYATVLQRLVQATKPATLSAVTPPKSEDTEQPADLKLHSTVEAKTLDTGNSPDMLSARTPVNETVAENQSIPALVLEVLTMRDRVQAVLEIIKTSPELAPPSGESLEKLSHFDETLRKQAGAIALFSQSADWRASFSPKETYWWWFLKAPTTPWSDRLDWLWSAVSVSFLTVSLGLMGDIAPRFLTGGPDSFGAFTVSAQSVLTLLVAGGALTKAGQEALKSFLKAINIPEKYWHELGAFGSLIVVCIFFSLRQSLPQIGTNFYTNPGIESRRNGDWSSAESQFKRAIQLNADDAQAHFQLGLLYEDLQLIDQARPQYQLAIQGGIPAATNNLARLNIMKKEYTAAVSLLLKAYDPFCGGGSIPLEAQRLGLEAHGSDLNPVAVLITKALIEIPPKFKDKPPVNPEAQKKLKTARWYGAQGLAEDVRYYGQWMRDEAFKRIGHLYPKVNLPQEYGGGEATVIAWLWARTVKCPNPACGAQMPLVKSFALSTKKGKEAWVEPVIDRSQQPPIVQFEIRTQEIQEKKYKEAKTDAERNSISLKPPDGTMNRKGATCICCETPVPFDYIRTEGQAKLIGAQLMAIVAEGQRQRMYLQPNAEHEVIASQVQTEWKPETELSTHPQYMATPRYGMTHHCDLWEQCDFVRC